VVPVNRQEIESILKDYHWMINSIKIMQDEAASSKGLVSQYGLEAGMPKQKGRTSDPVYGEVLRRSKYCERIEEYERKVKFIQDRLHLITDPRESEVLHWILEGKSLGWIGRHMGLSITHIRRIRSDIVDKMSETVQMAQMS